MLTTYAGNTWLFTKCQDLGPLLEKNAIDPVLGNLFELFSSVITTIKRASG